MFEPVYQYALVASGDRVFRPRAYGELEPDGRWSGWLVFFPVGRGTVISTERETTQATFTALSDWAAGLSTVYLEGALARAEALTPDAARSARLVELARIEASARSSTARFPDALTNARTMAVANCTARRRSPKKR